MARPAQIRIPESLAGPFFRDAPIEVVPLPDRTDALLHMPLPEDGDTRGAVALLSDGPQIRLLATQGSKKLLLVGRQKDTGVTGAKTVEVAVIHGDESLLAPLQGSLQQALRSYRSRAEITGRHTPSDEVLEAAGWSHYLCGERKVFYLEGA
jgi:hypothetical protein